MITPDDGRPVVAAFDFDGTLIPGDCLLMLHRQLKGVAGLALDWLHLIAPFQAWVGGSLSTAAFKERYLGVLLRGTTREARSAALGQKLPAAQWRALRPRALARLRWHQAQGHRVVIISASPRALIAPLAARLGVDLLATETSDPLAHGPATPLRLSSANCKGEEKVRRLGAWLDRPLEEISLHAYGDSRGDRQLLEVSTAPHWRSFGPDPLPYPARKPKAAPPGGWIPLLALLLLSLALFGLTGLDPVERLSLQGGLGRVMAWLPAIYGILGVAYLGRYWRWRLLLSSAGIGRWGWRDARAWFVGFALTATPGKLGELSRVQQLHRELDYPRPLLVHVFVAERLCDGAAVLLWLALLAPSALRAGLGRLPPTGIGLLLLAGAATLLAAIWIWRRWGGPWQHHLPSGALARACLPAGAVTLGIWACESLILWLLVQVVSPAHTVPIQAAIGTYLLSGSLGMLSTLPGGVGVNEGATILLLARFGVPPSAGLAIAILRRLCTVWSVTGLAVLLGWWRGSREGP